MSLLIQKDQKTKGLLIEKSSENENKPTRYFSKKQEDKVAEAVKGSRNINSGATMFIKGDVQTSDDSFLIECKTKTSHADSISIKKDWIEKNRQEALFMNKKHSALAFNFGPDEPNYYIIDEYLFQQLLEHLQNDIGEE